MPNIEIHGIPQEGAEEIRRGIFNLFASEFFVSEIVVTIFSTTVQNHLGETQPFLRVVSTPSQYTEQIILMLKEVFYSATGGEGIDIEVQELKAFHPKKPAQSFRAHF